LQEQQPDTTEQRPDGLPEAFARNKDHLPVKVFQLRQKLYRKANLYLHWFDKLFHSETGPYRWANARLVRYADDFVILARYVDDSICSWVESWLEGRFQLEVNRDKTRVVRLDEPGSHLDFLGFTFRYDRDLQGRPWRVSGGVYGR